MPRLKKALITGAAGFIGSHLAERLLKEGWQVHAIDNFQSGKMENLINCWGMRKFNFIEADINYIKEYSFLEGGNGMPINDFDVVFHLAARPRVGYSVKWPLETNKNNLDETLEVLEWSKTHAQRLVFASSSSVYGVGDDKLKEDDKCVPCSPYALQKLASEEYCRLYSLLYGLDTISLRFFNVYGNRMDVKGDYANLIPKHLSRAKKGKELPIYGDGENRRSFVYVGDVVKALILAAGCKGRKNGAVYNIGNNRNFSVKEVDAVIAEVIHKKIKQNFLPAKSGESRYSIADITKARQELKWEPKVSLRQGICRIMDNY